MITRGGTLLAIGLASGMVATATAQSHTPYQPVEQYIGDMNPLSTSLRRLHIGIARPTGFQDVFHVPGEPGKLMRVHGSVQAVFPHSLYGFNDDEEIEAVIPPNTVFRIGPRAVSGSTGMVMMNNYPGLPGQGRAGEPEQAETDESRGQSDSTRVIPEGFGRGAVLPRANQRSVLASRPASPALRAMREEMNDEDPLPQAIEAPGTIIGDEKYRRERLHVLLRQAAAAD